MRTGLNRERIDTHDPSRRETGGRREPRTGFSESLCTENARSKAFLLVPPRSLLQRLSEALYLP